MVKIIKKIIKLFFKKLGYEIRWQYPELVQMSFNEIYQKFFHKTKVIIFDVGANKGQSIKRFTDLFQESKEFFVNHYTGSSSFFKTKENTEWIKLRSKQIKITPEEFLKKKENVEIDTVDNYCYQNNINEIDIIKIDTQGYEDKVLIGCKKMIEEKKIKFIELEIILSDIYDKTLSISDIESQLKNNYRLFANDYYGNLYSNKIYQLNLIYINKDFYRKIKNL